MKSSLKSIIYFYAIILLIFIFEISSCKSLNKNLRALGDDDEITTITKDDESELEAAIEILNESGGTIYIDTPIINLAKESSLLLSGKLPGGIIGLRQPNGEYPIIHFLNSGKQDLLAGINIYGSNKFIEYMIIENSSNYGISVIGSSNIFDHVISRYNFGSGFFVFGDFNTFNYCYAYRNCDANIYSVNADGFQILGELNNVFNYCFAWDNSNSGFNYARIFNSSDLSYLHSGSWNNGNINVFTGKYDYDNGAPLDKNLWTIQEIMESDPNFASNYYNKKYSINEAHLDEMPAQTWVSYVSAKMDSNGFTFGNRNSSQSIDVKRNSNFNVAFDNKNGGFIDDFNHKYNAFITDCVSFNNGINYKLPYTFSKWSNNWSWGSRNKDQLNGGVTAKTPTNRNINTAQRSLYSVRDQIIRSVTANIFPDGINFDKAISSLQ